MASSGVMASPVRRIWPCGRRMDNSLPCAVTCSPDGVRNAQTDPSGAISTRSRLPGNQRSAIASDRADAGAAGESNMVPGGLMISELDEIIPELDEGSTDRGPFVRLRDRALSGRASAASRTSRTRSASAGPVASGWSATKAPKKPARTVSPGAMLSSSEARAARVCSCWSRWDGRRETSSTGRPCFRARSWRESVAHPVPRPNEPRTAHGWHSPGMFCRTATALPNSGSVMTDRSRYWLT